MAGYAGDTLASALLANGVKLVGRSFKYHRPRGIFSAGPEEPNALVELRSGARAEPNTRATTQSSSMTGWTHQPEPLAVAAPSTCMSINQLPGRSSSPASTTRPSCGRRNSGKKLYEPLIRRAAGLGRAPSGLDPDHYEKACLCDVLVDRRRPGRPCGAGGGPRRCARHPRARRTIASAAAC
jgi:hypothetical protein